MVAINVDPTFEDRVAAGVLAAYEAEGYVKTVDGEPVKNNLALSEAVYDVVSQAKASTKAERLTVPVTRGTLAGKVFPNLAGPGSEAYDKDELVRTVHTAVEQACWQEASTGHSKRVQRFVGERMPGYVLLRTKVGVDHIWAAYVSDSAELILLDLSGPLKDKIRRAAEDLAKNLGMVVNRKPEMRSAIAKEVEQGTKAAAFAAKSVLAITTGGGGEE